MQPQKTIESKMHKNRKIHFKVWNRDGTSYMRSKQIAHKLNSRGWDNIHLIEDDSYKLIRNSIIMFIKYIPSFDELETCKRNNNILIWDVIDYLKSIESIHLKSIKLLDIVIYTNSNFKKIMEDMTEDSNGIVIPHHWDERLIANKLDELYMGYVGARESLAYYNNIQELNVPMYIHNHMNFIDKVNCFIDIKHTSNLDYFIKPATKLSNAAALNSNIILNRYFGAIDLLDPEYPYLCDNDWESVKNMIEYAKESYGSDIWKKGLKMLKPVKEKTSLTAIIPRYEELFNSI